MRPLHNETRAKGLPVSGSVLACKYSRHSSDLKTFRNVLGTLRRVPSDSEISFCPKATSYVPHSDVSMRQHILVAMATGASENRGGILHLHVAWIANPLQCMFKLCGMNTLACNLRQQSWLGGARTIRPSMGSRLAKPAQDIRHIMQYAFGGRSRKRHLGYQCTTNNE